MSCFYILIQCCLCSDGYHLVLTLAKAMKKQLAAATLLGSKAHIPVFYATSLVLRALYKAPSFVVTSQALDTALLMMEEGKRLKFVAAILLEYTNPAVGNPW